MSCHACCTSMCTPFHHAVGLSFDSNALREVVQRSAYFSVALILRSYLSYINANTDQTSRWKYTGLSMLCFENTASLSIDLCIFFHSLHEPHHPCNEVLQDVFCHSTERVVSSLEYPTILIYHSSTLPHQRRPSPD